MRPLLPLFVAVFTAAAPVLAIEPVATGHFRSVQLRGGGEVIVRPGPVQRVTILEGSSRISRIYTGRQGQLTIDRCQGRCPSGYKLLVEVQSPQAPDVAIHGGGAIHALAGFRPQGHLAAAVHGGGAIDLRAVEAGNVAAAVHGGGRIHVRPRASLQAAVHGGGEVRYAGNPQVMMAVHGGGIVRREN